MILHKKSIESRFDKQVKVNSPFNGPFNINTAENYIKNKNDLFLGTGDDGNYYVIDLKQMNFNSQQVDFYKLQGKHSRSIKPISFEARISKVNVPEDLVYESCDICPQCCNTQMEKVKVWDGKDYEYSRPNYYETKICSECSNTVIQISDCVYGDILEENGLVYPTDAMFDLQVQEIIIDHPESMKTVDVYVISNYPMFSKKDVGKFYIFEGFLNRHPNNKTSNNYMMVAPSISLPRVVNEETDEIIPNRDDVPPEWRKNVLARDQKCVICGGEKHLEAHHIFGYKGYPELRDNVDNGITLCQFCHGNYHSQYGVKNPNPVTFVNFIKGFR